MRFIVDESAGVAVANYLRVTGHDVLAIAEIAPRAGDTDILALAVDDKRILVTNDKDFGELVFRSRQDHHGVMLFRLKDESAVNQVRILADVLHRYADRLSGQFIVITETKIRIR